MCSTKAIASVTEELPDAVMVTESVLAVSRVANCAAVAVIPSTVTTPSVLPLRVFKSAIFALVSASVTVTATVSLVPSRDREPTPY